jgi:hypothetical protein
VLCYTEAKDNLSFGTELLEYYENYETYRYYYYNYRSGSCLFYNKDFMDNCNIFNTGSIHFGSCLRFISISEKRLKNKGTTLYVIQDYR